MFFGNPMSNEDYNYDYEVPTTPENSVFTAAPTGALLEDSAFTAAPTVALQDSTFTAAPTVLKDVTNTFKTPDELRTLTRKCDLSTTRTLKERVLNGFKQYILENGNSEEISDMSYEVLDLALANFVVQWKNKNNKELDTTTVSAYAR